MQLLHGDCLELMKNIPDKMMNDNEMALEALKWIVNDVAERKDEAEHETKDDFSKGRELAYEEIFDLIRSRLEILNIQLSE